jgi:hypothetical protein
VSFFWYSGAPEAQTQAGGTSDGVGLSDGVATVTGVGSSVAASVGASDGAATVTGVGASTTAAVGASDGVATVTGAGSSIAAAVGTSTGTSTAEGVGDTAGGTQGAGASDGTSTATGVGSSVAAAVGLSDGAATVTGVGAAIGSGVGASDGAASTAGVGASTGAGAGSSAGTGTATGVPGSDGTTDGVGASAGSATATGVGTAVVGESVTTTYPLIRDRQAYLIETATPKRLSHVRFQREEGRIDFRQWVAKNPTAALRRFQIMGSMRLGLLASTAEREVRRTETTVTVAYPRAAQATVKRDLRDVVFEDMDSIDHVIGLRGFAGNMPGQWLGRRVSGVQIDEVPSALFATATYEVEWRRSV